MDANDLQTRPFGSLTLTGLGHSCCRCLLQISFKVFLEEHRRECCWCPALSSCSLKALVFLWEHSLVTSVHCVWPCGSLPASHRPQTMQMVIKTQLQFLLGEITLSHGSCAGSQSPPVELSSGCPWYLFSDLPFVGYPPFPLACPQPPTGVSQELLPHK